VVTDGTARRLVASVGSAIVLAGALACGDDVPESATGDATTTGGAGTTGAPAGSAGPSSGVDDTGSDSTGAPADDGPWAPGKAYPSTREIDARGFLDLRGLVHTHSPLSHDACDGEPWDESGVVDAQCMEDLREGLCAVQHDFVFFTDHRESFSDREFPEVLLHDPELGDALVERDGTPVASWAGCDGIADDVLATLVMAGCEAGTMPVGLEGHAPGRGTTYGDVTPEAIAEMKAQGAVVLVAHTEDWTPEVLLDLPLDGFEMYNLHANLLANLSAGLLVLEQLDDPRLLPHSDLIVLPIFQEDPRYLERWGTVLARGGRPVTTMGSDAHRNTFPDLLPDGERVDSFRRMMKWFSNHVRVRPEPDGTWDDRHVKEALAARRLYGAFEYMGYPEGFDARMETRGAVLEIGDEATLADAPQIVVTRPGVRGLDPAADPPDFELRVLAAREGGFDLVASGTGPELHYAVLAPGAYRVEVRMAPRHLAGWLGAYEALATELRPWIYTNAFFVTAAR
jgi:hypothetical protein